MLVLESGVRKARIDSLTFSPDGRALAAPVEGHGVLLWEAFTSGAKARAFPLPDGGAVRAIFSPTDDILFAGYTRLSVLDLRTGTANQVPTDIWLTLAFGVSLDGSRLVVAEPNRAGWTYHLTCWAADAFIEPLWKSKTQGLIASSPPLFLPGNEHFVLCERYRDKTPTGWYATRNTYAVSTGALIETSDHLAAAPEAAVLSADGQWLACQGHTTIHVYPAQGKWKTVPTLKSDSRKHFTGIAFHPSERFLAATSNDATVKLYDTATWEVARTFTWNIGRMRSVAFSPDGTLAAAGSDTGKVVVWDVDL